MQVLERKSPSSKGYDVDAMAAQLAHLGRTARQMPRSFDSVGMTYNVDSPSGGPGSLGKMLPGRGFLCGVDLRTLGLHKRPRGVLDPSAFRRRMDRVEVKTLEERQWDRMLEGRGWDHVEGGAITGGYDDIINHRAGGKASDVAFSKLSVTTTVAQQWCCNAQTGGNPPGLTYLNTTAPTDAVLDATNAAAISKYLRATTSTDKSYLLTFGFGASQQINMAVLVDILVHSGIFRNTVTTEEIVAAPTNATREYGPGTGIGNLFTAVDAVAAGTGGVAGTSTWKYIDQGGVSTAAPALTTAAGVCNINSLLPSCSAYITAGAGSFFIPIDPADTGVRSIKSHQLSVVGTGATSGFAGLVFFPLSFVPGVAANAYIERDSTSQIDGVTELIQVSNVTGFLSMFLLTNTTSSGVVTGFLRTVNG